MRNNGMTITEAQKKIIIENLIRYGVYFLLAVATPFLAMLIAPLFDGWVIEWSQRGDLREFYTQVFTCIFWGVEFLAGFLIGRKLKSKGIIVGREHLFPVKDEPQELEREIAAADGEARNGKFLPMRNVIFLSLIVSACVLLISMQIDFQVKPFYDIGEKVSINGLLIKCSMIVCNVVKCIWITLLLKSGCSLMEAIVSALNKENLKWLVWVGAGILLFGFGIYDVVMSANPFAWTYLLFYIAFTAVYYFTERNNGKAYLLIFFIYIF